MTYATFMRHIGLLTLLLFWTGCNTTTVVHMLDRHALYQTAPLSYLQSGNYNTSITVQQFKSIGNIGTGVFDGFDGEAAMLNGIVYQATADGRLSLPADEARLLFGSCMLFDVEKRFTMRNIPSYADFQKALQKHFSTNILIRAVQAEGVFHAITVACHEKQEFPYKPYHEASRNMRQHTWKEIKGTLVGFWIPTTVPEAIMPAGFHLLFISEDRTLGGRVVDFQSDKLIIFFKHVMRLTVNYSPAATTHFDIPEKK